MRFSVCLHSRRSWPDLLAVARHAGATGWEGIWFPDDVDPALECWAAIGALAAAIPEVRLGALVDIDRGRHPAVVAKLATTVDQLSRGRVVLGLVAGPGADARARLEETCQVVTSLVAADRSTFDGRFYHLHAAPLDPKGLQQPLPLLLLDGGDGDTAAIAARHATRWCLTGSPEAVAGRIRDVGHLCEEQGRDPAGLTFAVWGGAIDLQERYREIGVDEWIVPETALEVLDRIISQPFGSGGSPP